MRYLSSKNINHYLLINRSRFEIYFISVTDTEICTHGHLPQLALQHLAFFFLGEIKFCW